MVKQACKPCKPCKRRANAGVFSISITPKQRNRVWEGIHIVCKTHQALSIPVDHGRRANGIEVVHVDVRRRAFDVEDHRLAGLAVAGRGTCYANGQNIYPLPSNENDTEGSRRRTGIIVVEEAVQSCAIDQNTLRIHRAKSPSICAISGNTARRRSDVRIVQCRDGWEGDGGVGIGLVVSTCTSE